MGLYLSTVLFISFLLSPLFLKGKWLYKSFIIIIFHNIIYNNISCMTKQIYSTYILTCPKILERTFNFKLPRARRFHPHVFSKYLFKHILRTVQIIALLSTGIRNTKRNSKCIISILCAFILSFKKCYWIPSVSHMLF